MKGLLKKILVCMMVLTIITSSVNVPVTVKAASFYNITLNANGGYFSKKNSNVFKIQMPSQVGLKADSYYNPDKRTNYEFLGWSASKTATTATYKVNSVFPKKTATYYAVWRSTATTGVKIDQTNVKIKLGTTQKLTATVLPSYAANKNVRWSSSDSNFLKVSSDGTITPVRPGTATVTVTTVSGNYQASTTVTIVNGVWVDVSVTEDIANEQTITFEARSVEDTDENRIVGYTLNGVYTSVSPRHSLRVPEKVTSANIQYFIACTEKGACNYARTLPFANVKFDSNDESNQSKTCLFAYGTKPDIKKTQNLFKREGYYFAGWSKDPNANEPEEVTVTSNCTYYAVWYKVNVSDAPNVLSKNKITVKESFNPTAVYIKLTDPSGNLVEEDLTWEVEKTMGNSAAYRLEDNRWLYINNNPGSLLKLKSTDGRGRASVNVNKIQNIHFSYETIMNENSTCSLIYTITIKGAKLETCSFNGKTCRVEEIEDSDESIYTYKVEQNVEENGLQCLYVDAEDGSYCTYRSIINCFKQNYVHYFYKENILTDANGNSVATVTIDAGKSEQDIKGYYFGTSENYEENTFYDLSETYDNNEVSISSAGYITAKHFISENGKFKFTLIRNDGTVAGTYEVEVCKVHFDPNGGNLDRDDYYVFKGTNLSVKGLANPVNDAKNLIFRGWYLNDEVVENYSVTSDMTFKAKWRVNPFKDANGNDTGYEFSYDQLHFGFNNYAGDCTAGGHCFALALLTCRLATQGNDFDVSDFSKVGSNGTLTKITSASQFTNISGKESDTRYINQKTGITLNDYICGYQVGKNGIKTPRLESNNEGAKAVLDTVRNIKNTGSPVMITFSGLARFDDKVGDIAHAIVAFKVRKVKSSANYSEYAVSISDPNKITGEKTLKIWCNGDEESSDAEWGWSYEFSSVNIIGSEYDSKFSARVFDLNN